MARPRKPDPRPSLRLFSGRMTVADAKVLLEKLGGIDRRARLAETSTGTKDGRGRPYTKWRAEYGKRRWSLRREDVADVQEALRVLQEDAARVLSQLTPEQREALGGVKKTSDGTIPIRVYAGGRPPK